MILLSSSFVYEIPKLSLNACMIASFWIKTAKIYVSSECIDYPYVIMSNTQICISLFGKAVINDDKRSTNVPIASVNEGMLIFASCCLNYLLQMTFFR